MPDAETAIRVFNGLRRHLPLLQALAANSPFRHGRDTGLASAREVTMRGWPRSGVPRAMRDFEDFCETARAAGARGRRPRLHVVLVEAAPAPAARAPSRSARSTSQASLEDAAALVALTHCLARHAAEGEPGADPPAEVLEEGSFRAARFGIAAELPDDDGRLRPVAEWLDEALGLARPHADELGCDAELDDLAAIVESGGGAGRQRAAYEIAGMDALLRALTETTGAGTAAPPAPRGSLARTAPFAGA